jgi:hypothetical protein
VIVAPPPGRDAAATFADDEADLDDEADADLDAEPDAGVLPVLWSVFAAALVDFCGDLVGVFLGDADFLADAEGDVLGDAVEVPPGAVEVPPGGVQLAPFGDDDADGLDVGAVVELGPGVAGSEAGTSDGLGAPVLGLTGGLDAAPDEAAGLDDVSGVEVTGGLLVFGVVSCVAAGEAVGPRQVALGEAAGLDVVPAPAAL